MNKKETIIVRDNTFETTVGAVNKMVDLIRPTYGPASNKVIIDKAIYRMPVDDGVQIARDFELNDPVENAIVKLVRETAIRTNDRVGDGTTGALIMIQAIVNEVARRSKFDGRKIELEINKGFLEFEKAIRKSAKQIDSKEDLKKVALVAFDDEPIAEMIAELYHTLGRDALITIDKSPTMETYYDMTDGMKIDRGYISPYMVTNPDRMESVLEKPRILITDYRLTEIDDILPLMEKLVAENVRELVVIAEGIEQSALATMVINKLQNKFLTVAVTAPSGNNRKILLEDLSLLTGARMFTESKGDKLKEAKVEDLGRAKRFICRQSESIIVEPQGDKEKIKELTSALESAIETEQKEDPRKEMEKRLAYVTNKLAVIKVGAATEQAQKALRYKVEDAVHSTKAAYNGGVVCGAGLGLAAIKTSSPVLNKALERPVIQLMENMGIDENEIAALKVGEAMNVVTGETGDFMEVGVMDPVDVLVAGVESAVSVASTLVTSSGMIVDVPESSTPQAQ